MARLPLPLPLQRFLETGRDSWRARRALDGPSLRAHELDFMPAADALRASPPHPAPRWMLGIVLALAVLALAWSLLGRVDVIAIAEGKVLAAGRSKPVQTDGIAVVRAIHVQEGQQVRAGDLLVEFDARLTAAELHKLQEQRTLALLDQRRAQLLLAALRDGRAPDAATAADRADPAWQARVQAEYQEIQATLAQAGSAVAERSAEAAAMRASIMALRGSLPIHREVAADYERLLEGRFVARHAWLERRRLVLEQEQQLASQQARLDQVQAAGQQALRQRERLAAEARRSLLTLQQDAAARLAAIDQDLDKARQRDDMMRLLAPVDGSVQQLAVSAPGAVVGPAQPVLVIVPADAPVEVEALLANRDAGFVRPGQSVQLKVDAFDFTRYGMLAGEVASVSADAIADPQLGPVYGVRIRLAPASTGRSLPLAPGMGVRAEIRTGSRRILDYFLSPLQRRVDESLHER